MYSNLDQMQVLDSTAGLISNFEVYHLLREKHALDNASKKLRHVPLIEAQVLGYISTTQAAMEEQQGVVQFLEHVKKYALTKAEVLQILNHCPTTEVELHLIVEQFEVRLAPEQRAELLEEISAFLSPQMAENGVAQESAPQGEEEEQAEEPEEEAAMEVEGAIEAVELGGEEEEDNELLHEEETKAGEEEEGMAADGEEDEDRKSVV